MKLLNKIIVAVALTATAFTPMMAQNHAVTYAPRVPKTMHFADRDVDLDRVDMYERLDRELISFTFGHFWI